MNNVQWDALQAKIDGIESNGEIVSSFQVDVVSAYLHVYVQTCHHHTFYISPFGNVSTNLIPIENVENTAVIKFPVEYCTK